MDNNQITEHPQSPSNRKNNNGSSQLKRWSRARVIKYGRKLHHPVNVKDHNKDDTQFHDPLEGADVYHCSSSENDDIKMVRDRGKIIYMVSDGSERTAEHSVNAALGQFEHFLMNTRLFSGAMQSRSPKHPLISSLAASIKLFVWHMKDKMIINDVERLMDIIVQAAKEDAILIYTLADEKMAASAQHACKVWGVRSTDILRPITDAIVCHLGVSPSGLPRGAPGRKFPLTEEYFKRIDAIEFTIKQDDGALPQNFCKADIVIAGVSRSGKTPLSIYLAQKGFKVANVPIVKGVELPKTLFEIDPKKVFALTINPVMLQTIRRARAKSLGLVEDENTNYAEMVHVREELEFAAKIFAQNPTWPVIEVTGKAIEEIAVIVLRLYQDQKHSAVTGTTQAA
ncbi:probable pyruvate, phosphate dikinase regulatory protein, chloroplastic [Tanacetum coccineum]